MKNIKRSRKLFRFICVYSNLLLLSCGSLYGQFKSLTPTAMGDIVVRQIDGESLFGNYAVLLNGKELFRDEGVSPSVGFSYPASTPNIVVISESIGGNLCPQHLRIIDLTGPEPKVNRDIGKCLNDNPEYRMLGGKLTIKDGNSDENQMRMEYVTYTPYSVDHTGTLAIRFADEKPRAVAALPEGDLAAHEGIYLSTDMVPVAVVIRLHPDGHIAGFLYKSVPEALDAIEAIKSGTAAEHPEVLSGPSFALLRGSLSYGKTSDPHLKEITPPLIMKLHLRLREGGEKDFICKALFRQANIVSAPPLFSSVNVDSNMRWVWMAHEPKQ